MTGPDIGLRLNIEITLLPSDSGGRKSPIHDGYRPIVIVDTGNNEVQIGLVQLKLTEEIAPGESGIGTLEFDRSVAGVAKPKLVPGTVFALAEGRRIVAEAKVVDLA